MVDDDTPITGGDMNPDDHSDTDNVYSSAGFHIPPEQVKLGIEIFKKICKLVKVVFDWLSLFKGVLWSIVSNRLQS